MWRLFCGCRAPLKHSCLVAELPGRPHAPPPGFPPGAPLAGGHFGDSEPPAHVSLLLCPFVSGRTHPSPAVSRSRLFITDGGGTGGQHQSVCVRALEKSLAMAYLGAGPSPSLPAAARPVDVLVAASHTGWWLSGEQQPQSGPAQAGGRLVMLGPPPAPAPPPPLECLSLLGAAPRPSPGLSSAR